MSAFQIPIEHLPPGYAVYGALYKDTTNAAFLQSQLLARNPEFEYALIDASTLLSSAHVLAAVFKAVWAAYKNALKTPNVHSETVLGLSPSFNIAEAYRRYGIGPESRNVVVIKIITDASKTLAAVEQHVAQKVQGTPVPLTDDAVAACTDVGKVKKYYKLNGVASLAGGPKSQAAPEKLREAEVLALGAMALRGL
ncbi:kinase binding protein [Ophiostoma piceae UAMH 11346]|uniref:EKC/KEOPS complex subunit CGI121 n=1 Tax=Ophiostoma piceae (strain UAMH 11346) TaxID=1262450 RepID=S3C8J8_OPHP1|nr:kinase binding protein [Ophiostoma piceae UAMH 11346]